MRKRKDFKSVIHTAVGMFIFGAVVVVCVLAAPSVIAVYRSNEAEKALADGRLERAVEMLLPELERNPKDMDLRLKLVDLYCQLENYSRAEYLLSHGMREVGGQTELYRLLCEVFVKQDKLYDAVALLNGITNPNIKSDIEKMRPQPPVFDPLPGDFRESLTVSVVAPGTALCYVSTNSEVPSTDTPYTEPLFMPQGITEVRAVSVSADGLVSDWASGNYRLDDVIEPVEFKDAEIERVVREMLDIPAGIIISDKLQEITVLELPEPAVYETLNDLRYFTHLKTLTLTGADFEVDISSLALLSELTSLKLNHMGLDSLSLDTIGQMTWLTELDLSSNNIVSLEALTGLKSLSFLALNSNNILDFTPLAGLSSLKTLQLSQNAAEDTSPLAPLTGLQSLYLNENRIRSLSGLTNMTQLKELDISGNSVFNITYLKNLTALETLNMSSNKGLSSITSLSPLVNLVTMTADGCSIESVEGLSGMTKLKTLSLNDNALSALTGLEGAVSLSVLWANKNSLETLRALSELTNLTEVHVEYNHLPSLVALKNIPSLKSVYAFGNTLTEDVTFADTVTVYKD